MFPMQSFCQLPKLKQKGFKEKEMNKKNCIKQKAIPGDSARIFCNKLKYC